MMPTADIPRSALSPEIVVVKTVASDTGQLVNSLLEHFSKQRIQSTAIATTPPLENELSSLFHECRVAGWDGGDAVPVSYRTITNARNFVRVLPVGIQLPEVSAEPDGAIAFDWFVSRYRMLSVSVGQNDRLAYAWLEGDNSDRGVERFENGVFPVKLKSIIEHICGV